MELVLTPNEINALQIFTSEAGSFPTVYKIAKDYVERQRDAYIKSSITRKTQTNEEIGAKLRAFDEGVFMVEGLFREIIKYQKPTITAAVNHAR